MIPRINKYYVVKFNNEKEDYVNFRSVDIIEQSMHSGIKYYCDHANIAVATRFNSKQSALKWSKKYLSEDTNVFEIIPITEIIGEDDITKAEIIDLKNYIKCHYKNGAEIK